MRILVITGFYPGKRMGGAEYQCSLIAAGLRKRDHTVGFIGTNTGQEDHRHIDDVEVWDLPGWRAVGGRRHRLDLERIIKSFQPEVVYVRLMSELVDIAAICRPAGIPIVSASSSVKETGAILPGENVKESLVQLQKGDTRRHYQSFQSIGYSAAHISNTKQFTEIMHRRYPGKQVLTIYNASPNPPENQVHSESSGQVIWVNNLRRIKRPEYYLRLAAALPEYQFVMIGGTFGRYGDGLLRMMKDIPNLVYMGSQPIDVVNTKIAESDLLVYTTDKGKEGFGNSFLQAWFRGVPTVSTFEMDYIPINEGIGRVSDSLEDLISDVRELMVNDKERLTMGQRAFEYAHRAHQVDVMVDSFESLFAEIVASDNCTEGSKIPTSSATVIRHG